MELRFWKKNNFFFFFKISKCIRTYRESKYAVMEPFSIFFLFYHLRIISLIQIP